MKRLTVQNGAKSGFVKEKKFEKKFTNYLTKGDTMGICPYFFTKKPKNFVNHLTNALQNFRNRVE